MDSSEYNQEKEMEFLHVVIILAMMITIGVLATGIWSMAHGGEFDREHSDQFMMARVGAQAVTVLLLLLAVFLAS